MRKGLICTLHGSASGSGIPRSYVTGSRTSGGASREQDAVQVSTSAARAVHTIQIGLIMILPPSFSRFLRDQRGSFGSFRI